ncbi:MAG TPA: IS200/IS605 family transposase [Pirellulales bacterium]|nr:IS200/IS605 family transposase [Pirellulales bacterium]
MANTYTNLLYHIVFSTKDRISLIEPSVRPDLHGYLGGIVRELGGTALEIGGVADHVHLLVKLPPKIAISDFMRELKANSSKWMNEQRMKLRKFGWQDGYAAFSVSKSQVPSVRNTSKIKSVIISGWASRKSFGDCCGGTKLNLMSDTFGDDFDGLRLR